MENKIDDNSQDKCAIKLKVTETFSLFSNYFDNAFGQKIKGSDVRKGAVYTAIGSGMLLLTIIPYIGILFAIFGVMLEFLGIKKLSCNAKNEKSIFKNFIFSYLLILIAIILFMIGMIANIGLFFNPFSNSLSSTGLMLIVVSFIAIILSVIFIYKYLTSISVEYNVPLMKSIGIGYIVGTILVPLFGIGFFILVIVHIAKIVTYLNIEK